MKWLIDGAGWTDNKCVGEMLTFVKDKNGKPAAKEGTHDDEVMCFGIGLQVHAIVPFENEEELSMTGIDNYGLKPTETKIKGTGDIKILTDANVDKFSLMLECHKETGFSNG